MMPKVGDNKETSRPEAYEIHLYSRRGDRVGYGAASTKSGSEHKGVEAVHRSEGDCWMSDIVAKETGEGNVERTRRGRGDDDRATVIEIARVEQVHEAHEVAATGRHDRHEEA